VISSPLTLIQTICLASHNSTQPAPIQILHLMLY